MAENEEQDSRSRKSGKTGRYVLIGLLVVVVLIVVGYEGMHYTSRPQFCTSCHEIAPQVASWQKGPHSTVECLDCHAAPGNLGYVMRKIGAYKEIYYHFTNQVPAQITWTPHIDACLNCHSDKNSAYPNAINITLLPGSAANAPPISHQPMLAGNVNCLSCHGNVGHGPLAVPYVQNQTQSQS